MENGVAILWKNYLQLFVKSSCKKQRAPRAVGYAHGYIVSILGNAAFLIARPWNTPGLFLYLIKRKNNGTTGKGLWVFHAQR